MLQLLIDSINYTRLGNFDALDKRKQMHFIFEAFEILKSVKAT